MQGGKLYFCVLGCFVCLDLLLVLVFFIVSKLFLSCSFCSTVEVSSQIVWEFIQWIFWRILQLKNNKKQVEINITTLQFLSALQQYYCTNDGWNVKSSSYTFCISKIWLENLWALSFHILEGVFSILKGKRRNGMTSVTSQIQIFGTFVAYRLSEKHCNLLTNDTLWGLMCSTQICFFFKYFADWMIDLKDIWDLSFQNNADTSLALLTQGDV